MQPEAAKKQQVGLKYPECQKGGYHVGQILNLVCVQPKCLSKCIICGLCYDEEHKYHNIKPLKMVIHNSQKYLEQLTPMQLDFDKLKGDISETREKMLLRFDDFEKYLVSAIGSIKDSLTTVFTKMEKQAELKAGNNDDLLQTLKELKVQEIEHEKFVSLMKKLLAGVPMDCDEEDCEISAKELDNSLKKIQATLEHDLQENETKIKQDMDNYVNKLKKIAANPPIFKVQADFKFSAELHHTGVEVVSETVIKSTEAYNYHFALMEPSVQDKGNKAISVSFKIRESTSSWLAVGLCHKNIIQANSFNFNYSTLGHGAYMISANGGSWSSLDLSKNNVVNSFHFYKDDVIIVNYNPGLGTIVFSKKGTDETHTIEFQNKEDDQLYLCGLFYYANDEIQYAGHD